MENIDIDDPLCYSISSKFGPIIWDRRRCELKVVLASSYPASMIVAAFKAAIVFDKSWKAEESLGDPIQTPRGLVKSLGATVFPTYEARSFCFFGPKVIMRGETSFILLPLLEDRAYNEVEIKVRFVYKTNADVTEFCIASNPASENFSPMRKHWDDFMREFYSFLEKAS